MIFIKKIKSAIACLVMCAIVVSSFAVFTVVGNAESSGQNLEFTDWMLETLVPGDVNLNDPAYTVERAGVRYAKTTGKWSFDAVKEGDYATREAFVYTAFTDDKCDKYTTGYGSSECWNLIQLYIENDISEVYTSDNDGYEFPAVINVNEPGAMGTIFGIQWNGELVDTYTSTRVRTGYNNGNPYTLLWSVDDGKTIEDENGNKKVLSVKVPVYCAVESWNYAASKENVPAGDYIVEEGPFVRYAKNPAEFKADDPVNVWSEWVEAKDLENKVKSNPGAFEVENAKYRYKYTVWSDWTTDYKLSGDYYNERAFISFSYVDDDHIFFSSMSNNTSSCKNLVKIYSQYPISNMTLATPSLTEGDKPYTPYISDNFGYWLPRTIRSGDTIPGLGYIYLITENDQPIDAFICGTGENVHSQFSEFYCNHNQYMWGYPVYSQWLFQTKGTSEEWKYTNEDITGRKGLTVETVENGYSRYRVKCDENGWSVWMTKGELPSSVKNHDSDYDIESVKYRYKGDNGEWIGTNNKPTDKEYETGNFVRYRSKQLSYGTTLSLDSVTVEEGNNSFVLNLKLTNNRSINTLEIGSLEYNTDVFELIEVKNSNEMFGSMDSSDAPRYLWTNPTDAVNGNLASLIFKVKDNAPFSETSTFTFSISDVTAEDVLGRSVKMTLQDASVKLMVKDDTELQSKISELEKQIADLIKEAEESLDDEAKTKQNILAYVLKNLPAGESSMSDEYQKAIIDEILKQMGTDEDIDIDALKSELYDEIYKAVLKQIENEQIAKEAANTDDVNAGAGTFLSSGSIWIILAVVVLAVAGAVAVILMKKKKV